LAARHPDWVLGFGDEVWWSRVARPSLRAWTEADRPLRRHEVVPAADDPDPKALACSGLLRRWVQPDGACHERRWLRCVDGRPVSALTTQFLAWCCEKLAAAGKRALLLGWDNASWHISKDVRTWVRAHNRRGKQTGQGVRLLLCQLPSKSPWLNPIEPTWGHGKRKVVEPDRVLPARELAERVCKVFDCAYEAHLTIPKQAA
jgi:DDE superfamily endonuclease